MALHWPTFFTRLGSAVVFSAIMMVGLLWNEWAFLGLALVIMVLCLRDYFRIGKKIISERFPNRMVLLVILFAVVCLLTTAWLTAPLSVAPGWHTSIVPGWHVTIMPPIPWPALVCLPILVIIWPALSKSGFLLPGLYALGGLVYVALPCVLLVFLYDIYWAIPLALILMIWMNDTMAYLVGSFIGKTPFSKISPKKTWEGTAGGAILTIAGAAIWGYFSPVYHMIDWIMLALCASVAGTAGDLFESKLKRMADVKDSGTMMPGHGGALDRFDSLLVATPFAFAYAWLFMQN